MKRIITAITVTGIAGTAGAAFAAMDNPHTEKAVQAEGVDVSTTARALTYQVGDAADVNLNLSSGASGETLTVTSVIPHGWTVLGWTSAASSVSVQITDGTQVVTFTATVSGGQVTTSITTTPVASTSTATASTVPAPAPAIPAATPVVVVSPTSSAHTTSPSKTGSEGEDDDEGTEHDDDDHDGFEVEGDDD